MNDRQRMVKKGLLKAVDIRVLCVADYTERIKKTSTRRRLQSGSKQARETSITGPDSFIKLSSDDFIYER